jgi:hypothetical protein
MAAELSEESGSLSEATFLVEASKRYSEMYLLRAAIQVIPGLGGPLDTLLAGAGANWQAKRFEAFIGELTEKLNSVRQSIPELTLEEPLYDLMKQVFDQVISHRSEEKRRRFVNIVARQVVERHEWEEAETAARLLADLTELHIAILNAAVNAPICSRDFKGLRVIAFRRTRYNEPLDLREVFPNLSVSVLRMCCIELLSRGLLRDHGVSLQGASACEFFQPTELGDWFIGWIRDLDDL